MKLTINEFYEDNTGEYLVSKYYINDQQVSEEEFDEVFEALNDCDCEDNEIDDDCGCDCINCTIDRFTEELQELTGGCPGCIREILCSFFDCMVDHIVVEDLDD